MSPQTSPRPTGRVPEHSSFTVGVVGVTGTIGSRVARLLADADAIVQTISPELRSGDVVAILSNGGFGGIYEKLPARLKQLAARK